jgi:glycosyltransferase involved in cell wall biosynthesis
MRQKRILIFCPYPEDVAPSQRLKYEQYLDYLRASGYRITVLPFFTRKTYSILYRQGYTLRKALGVLLGLGSRLLQAFRIPFVDGIYVHLNVLPVGPAWLERLYVFLARAMIYDIDDMVHLLPTSSVNKLASRFKSSERFFVLMREASHVITCTPALDELAQRYNSRSTDISSTINTRTYLPCNPYSNDNPLVIGWSGSYSTAPYLHLLDDVLRQLARQHRFILLVMGAPADFSISGVTTEVVSWSEAVEISTLQRMDIGLYPLPNDEWVKGKSGLKALQYMALGLPVVASAVGCNYRVINHGVSGLLVGTQEEWFGALSRLIMNPQLRLELGLAARARVERLYSVDANKETYLSIFKEVYGAAP